MLFTRSAYSLLFFPSIFLKGIKKQANVIELNIYWSDNEDNVFSRDNCTAVAMTDSYGKTATVAPKDSTAQASGFTDFSGMAGADQNGRHASSSGASGVQAASSGNGHAKGAAGGSATAASSDLGFPASHGSQFDGRKK